MFPPTIASRPTKRSLRELVWGAVDTALEFATLGEATTPRPTPRPHAAPTSEHPHRRPIDRHPRRRRPGTVRPRAQVCRSPLPRPRPARPPPPPPPPLGGRR